MRNIKENKIIYGDYMVYSPDNLLMFRCSEKKIKWYLDRNLGEKIDDRSIKLTFTPNGLGNNEHGYGLSPISNICVSCGIDKFLSKHHIVPYCYRKYLPNSYKSHNFHDIVVLCKNCHNEYERKADELKFILSKEYNAPLKGIENPNFKILKKVKKIANNILNYRNRIPKNKLDYLLLEIKSYLKKDDPTNDDMLLLSNLKINPIIKTHGEVVISQIKNIDDFIIKWRKHFINNCHCEFLPNGWNLNFKK